MTLCKSQPAPAVDARQSLVSLHDESHSSNKNVKGREPSEALWHHSSMEKLYQLDTRAEKLDHVFSMCGSRNTGTVSADEVPCLIVP